MTHWCRDVQRDEAVRASEDGRSGPLPTLEDAIAAITQKGNDMATKAEIQAADYRAEATSERTEGVTERRPVPPGGGGNVTGLHTERVVIEIEHSGPNPIDLHDLAVHLRTRLGLFVGLKRVEEVALDPAWAERIPALRRAAAAIRERDEQETRVSVLQAAVESARDERDAAIRERNEAIRDLRSVTAERAKLEEQLESVADRAAAAETALQSAPAASVNGGLNPHAWGVLLELHQAARDGWDRLEKALAAAERLLTQPRPASLADRVALLHKLEQCGIPIPATPAASGAAGTEPVAWAILRGGHFIVATVNEAAANESCKDYGGTVVPLYAAPQAAPGWLTAEERGSIQHAANLAKASWSYSVAQELENILARSSPPEVALPPFKDEVTGGPWAVAGYNSAIEVCREAIAAAGVPWKEVGQ